MANPKKPSDKELLELGKKLQDFYDSGYVDKKQSILFAVYKGIASGLGAIIGGTIVIALLLWILGLFDHVPLIGHFVDSVQNTIQSGQ